MNFRESKLAHKYLDGLVGIEIGGAAHNPFGLNTINVDNALESSFKQAEMNLCGNVLPIDIFSEGDDLPFGDNSYDFIISSHVLEHFYDPIKALKEWYRVVKNGGYLFMIVPHKDRTFDSNRQRTTLSELLERPSNNKNNAAPENDHWSVWITEDVVEICNYLNYQVVKIEDVDDKVRNGFTIIIKVKKQLQETRANTISFERRILREFLRCICMIRNSKITLIRICCVLRTMSFGEIIRKILSMLKLSS